MSIISISETIPCSAQKSSISWVSAKPPIPDPARLYRIATNELNQYYRSSKYKPQSLQQLMENPQMEKLLHENAADEREMMEQELKAYDDYNRIRQNLLKLDIKYQEVISLRYFEQKTNTEIGEILGKNEGTVKSLLSRGLEKLRNML
jgi:RNA polymerase sigma-70 factor (ECF subfamily)